MNGHRRATLGMLELTLQNGNRATKHRVEVETKKIFNCMKNRGIQLGHNVDLVFPRFNPKFEPQGNGQLAHIRVEFSFQFRLEGINVIHGETSVVYRMPNSRSFSLLYNDHVRKFLRAIMRTLHIPSSEGLSHSVWAIVFNEVLGRLNQTNNFLDYTVTLLATKGFYGLLKNKYATESLGSHALQFLKRFSSSVYEDVETYVFSVSENDIVDHLVVAKDTCQVVLNEDQTQAAIKRSRLYEDLSK